MLEVADNLERAFEVAGEDAKRVQELDLDRARALLGSLLDGLGLTDKILVQVRPPGAARCLLSDGRLHNEQLWRCTAAASCSGAFRRGPLRWLCRCSSRTAWSATGR